MLDATERKTLTGCAFVAAVLCAFPRDWVAAGGAAVLGLMLLGWHLFASRRERAG